MILRVFFLVLMESLSLGNSTVGDQCIKRVLDSIYGSKSYGLDASHWIGKKLSFEEAAAALVLALPEERTSLLVRQIEALKGKKIPWKSKEIKQLSDYNEVLQNVLVALTDASLNQPTFFRVYTRLPKVFIHDNVEILHQQLINSFLLNPVSLEEVSFSSTLMNRIKNTREIISSLFLIPQKNKSLQLTKKHINIIKKDGTQGLYRHLLYGKVGTKLSLNYVLAHVQNAQAALLVGSVALYAPELIQSYLEFKKLGKIDFDNTDDEKNAEKIINSLNQEPKELLKDLENNLDQLSEDPEKTKEYKTLIEELKKDMLP